MNKWTCNFCFNTEICFSHKFLISIFFVYLILYLFVYIHKSKTSTEILAICANWIHLYEKQTYFDYWVQGKRNVLYISSFSFHVFLSLIPNIFLSDSKWVIFGSLLALNYNSGSVKTPLAKAYLVKCYTFKNHP